MATYDKEIDYINSEVYLKLKERSIYGSSRVGVRSTDIDMLALHNPNYSMKSVKYEIGKRTYELSNHLGNVLSVISDKPIPSFEGGNLAGMLADVRVSQDYSPFGVTLSGRSFEVDGGYRYGFQGQEHDDEIKGKGNSVNYKYRMHDPRIGRFFAVDPLTSKYPHYTPYSFSGNKVIHAIELEGLEEHLLNNGETVNGPYSADYLDGFNEKYDKVINKQLVTNEIYRFDSYKSGESIVGNYLAKYIQKLPERPKNYVSPKSSDASEVKPSYDAATKMSQPSGICNVVTAARVNKAYEDLYGLTPIDFAQSEDGKYRSKSYKAASAQLGVENREYGVGSPLISQGLGSPIAPSNVWNGDLKKEAIIQYWDKTGYDQGERYGHSQVFLNYNDKGKMFLFDNGGYAGAPLEYSTRRYYYGTNLLDP